MKGKFLSRTGLGLTMAVVLALGIPANAAPGGPLQTPLILSGAFCASGGAVTGTGATFANNAHQNVFIPSYNAACGKGSVVYTSTGSGAGKFAAINRTHTFGMSDEPLSLDETLCATLDLGFSAPANGTCSLSPGQNRVSPIHHIPLALGSVTVSYNLNFAGCTFGAKALKFRSEVLGLMFTGAITKWNDQLLTADNPGLAAAACNKPIKLAVRQDGSGTTYVFKDFLSKRNPQFQVYKQNQLNTAWPSQDLGTNPPLRGSGNGGVADTIKNNAGAVGYVELSTAKSKGLTWGLVDGPHRQFLAPDQASSGGIGVAANCDEAATGATHPLATVLPGWDAVSITDTPNPTAYPVCSFTYALVYNNLKTAFGSAITMQKIRTLADYLLVAIDDPTQAKLNQYGYARLPVSLITVAQIGIATLTDQV